MSRVFTQIDETRCEEIRDGTMRENKETKQKWIPENFSALQLAESKWDITLGRVI